MLCIRMLPAQNGDCFLISMGEKSDVHILVDAGYSRTYHHFLKPYLQKISQNGSVLEKFIITHIDSDHIGGAIPFLTENGKSDSPQIIPVRQIWHNAYRHLQFKAQEDKEKYTTDKKKFEAILRSIVSKGYKSSEKPEERTISSHQGSTLGALILKGGYSWNNDFSGAAACVENSSTIQLENDAKIIILSPNTSKLKALDDSWRKSLSKRGCFGKISDTEYFDDAFEYYVSHESEIISSSSRRTISSSETAEIDDFLSSSFSEDTSFSNGSSIAFVLEYKSQKTLFLGDALPSQVSQSLKLYYSEEKFPIWFDAIKLSHHGSINNLNDELLGCVDSNNFLISTNGDVHKHPNKESLARIIARETLKPRNLIFNYPVKEAHLFNNQAWKDKYHYEVFMPVVGEPKVINLEVSDHGTTHIEFEAN